MLACAGIGLCWVVYSVGPEAPDKKEDPRATKHSRRVESPTVRVKEDRPTCNRSEAEEAAALSAAEIPAVLTALDKPGDRGLFTILLTSRWADHDPQTAAEWGGKVENMKFRRALLAVVAESWASRDLTASTAWARGIEDQGTRDEMLARLASHAGASEPEFAIGLAGELQDPVRRSESIQSVLGQWALKDPGAAAIWSSGLADPALRFEALQTVAATWASDDPSAAATLAIEGIPDEDALSRALPGILTGAARTDLPLMREWLQTFDEGRLKDLARAELTRIERDLPPAPASLPGEGVEERTPVKEASPKTKTNP